MNRSLLSALAILAGLAALVALVFLLTPESGGRAPVEEGSAAEQARAEERPAQPLGSVEPPERTALETGEPEIRRSAPFPGGTVVSPASLGCEVAGRAVNPRGEPVATAAVALVGWGGAHALPEGARWAGEQVVEDFGRTNEAGAFRFEGLPANLRYRATVVVRGTPPATSDVVTPGPGEAGVFGDVVVGREGTVTGTVLDLRGHPVNGASVAAFPLPSQGEATDALPFFEFEIAGGARTDAQGGFELRGLAPGRLLLVARGLDLGTAQAEVALGPEGRLDGVLLRLGEGDWIEGSIVSEDEEEVEGAIVRAEPLGPGMRFLVEADDFGDFEIEGVPTGVFYRLVVEAPGYGRGIYPRASAGDDEIEIRLEARPWIRGEITEEDGSWVPHARFGVFPVGRVPTIREIAAQALPFRANEDGEFATPVDMPGAYRVVAVAPGFAPSVSETLSIPTGGIEEVEIPLWKGASIAGTVSGGRRLLPAEVLLHEVPAGAAVAPAGNSLVALARADSRGRFLFSLVPEGRFVLEARAEGFVSTRSEPFEVKRGSEKGIEKDLVLVRPGAVTGRIEGAPRPAGGLRVAALGPDREVRASEPDASGAFRIEGLPPGRHLILLLPAERPLGEVATLDEATVRRFALAAAEARLEEGGTADVVLEAGRKEGKTVRGIVRRNGLPAPGLIVGCAPAERADALFSLGGPTTSTNEGGRFALEGLAPGSYVLHVLTSPSPKGGGLLLGRFSHVVSEGDSGEIEISVLSGRLRGRALAPSGEPLAGKRVLLAADASRGGAIDPLLAAARWDATTGTDGAFDAGEAPPGFYRISARGPDSLPLEALVSLEPGAESIGDVRLGRERDG